MSIDEIWRAIPGSESYEASNLGRVRSLPRTVTRSNGRKARYRGKMLASTGNGSSVHQNVFIRKEGARVLRYVHRLVYESFVGPIPEGLYIRHLDGDPTNNALENLTLGTPAENAADKERHGTLLYGEKHPSAKLTGAQVHYIRSQLSEGCRQKDLALFYGVTRANIAAIAQGRSHKRLATARGQTEGDRRHYRSLVPRIRRAKVLREVT